MLKMETAHKIVSDAKWKVKTVKVDDIVKGAGGWQLILGGVGTRILGFGHACSAEGRECLVHYTGGAWWYGVLHVCRIEHRR